MGESKLNFLARRLLEEIGFSSDSSDDCNWSHKAWEETYRKCGARLPKKGASCCPAIGLPCARKDCEVRYFNKNNNGLHGGFEDGAHEGLNRGKGKVG